MMNAQTKTYHIITWGCQMNEEDSEQMGLFLEQHGYLPVASADEADLVLLNTCSVRQKPEEKVFSKLGELRQAKRKNPAMVIGVCGCMAQIQADQIRRRAPHVDFIVGTGHSAEVPELARRVLEARTLHGGDVPPIVQTTLPPRRGAVVAEVPLRAINRPAQVRAYVPIMYGCDRFCTFCVVPATRGRERSRPPEDVLMEIESLARRGTREVTLLGQTVNSYGRNLPGQRVSFSDLLRRIARIPGIERIRFTSPHPRGFTDELIETIATVPQICEHVHLPLQAAEDELLRRMKRGYTVEEYWNILCKLRKAVPGIAVTTDIMLGFPGETDEQFRATLDFVRRARFDAAFMFAYSPRPGTAAAEMPDQVPDEVKIARLSALIEVQNRISAEINASLCGRVVEVLVEGPASRTPNQISGLTRTFKTVHIDVPAAGASGAAPRPGDLVMVQVVHGGLTGLNGRLVDGTTRCEPAGVPLATRVARQ